MVVTRCLITGSSSAIRTRLGVASFNVMRNCSIRLVLNSSPTNSRFQAALLFDSAGANRGNRPETINDYDCVHKINLGLVHRLGHVLLEKIAREFEELVGLRQGSRSILQTSRSACGFKFA